MSVVIETTLGDLTLDLFIKERPRASLNFLKLCKIKYYNYNLFHTISRGFIAQTGDPTGSRNGGESIFGVLEGPLKRYFEAERNPRIKHTTMGLVSFVGTDDHMIGSQFFITLGNDLTYLDEQHCIFGEIIEGLDVLELLNETICDQDNRPYQDVRITHTVILDDPFPDPDNLHVPSRSPSPTAERLQGGRIAPDEEIDETQGKNIDEVNEIVAAKEAKARATILEMIGDIPDAEMAPPENVLFVCKLNPVTTDDDLEIIFSRFGKINSCEVIRDKKTGESLQYAFVEFDDKKACEDAYFKMDNVLIDDRRIHVDFSQSVAKVKWHGKGRGITTYDDKGKRSSDTKNDLGNGRYKRSLPNNNDQMRFHHQDKQSKGGRGGERYTEFSKQKSEPENPEKKHRTRREDYYYDSARYRKEKSYEYYSSEKHSSRYDSHRSRDSKSDHKPREREYDHSKHYRSRSRSCEKFRNNSRKKGDGYIEKSSIERLHRDKYEGKRTSSVKTTKPQGSSKHLKQKGKYRSSSNEESSIEDSTSSEDKSSEKRRKLEKKHEQRYSRTNKDESRIKEKRREK